MILLNQYGDLIETKAASTPAVVGLGQPWPTEWGALPAIAGPAVTPETAMSVPAVKACVELISGAIGSLPVKVYQGKGEGRTEASEHPAYALVHDDACEWMSAGELRAQLVTDALLRGNGYGLIRRDTNGEPFEILHLRPEAVSTVVDQITGEPWFRVTVAGGQEIVGHADMIHLKAPGSLDGITGTATIQRARNAISLALALEHHAARIMKNGARPSGLLNAPGVRNRPEAQNLQASFGIQNADENSGGVATVYGGVTFTPIEFKSVDQQFMEQRAFQVAEIAKAFSVPPTLVGELAKATLSNSETMGRQFLTLTLMPWISALRAAFRRTLIRKEDRRTFEIDFVLDGLLQADSAQRAAFYASLRSAGIMTANEARARENLPAHPDGNKLDSPHVATPSTTPAPEPIADV
ncbi:phage portal protein [Methylorubrum sp. Q1]|uniref:phage portal protein n=1 Tax=Methylorubrum sp. Q1 TaxID=2562453 RepID=UPI001076729C|nr:phage portal protein [Methylorubrum sp. Q1]TFZ55915.1 phage portal protein [Methylorubrum sp. Q1]